VFARQMTALARAGWRTLTLAQFCERLGSPPPGSAFRVPRSEFLLTFDDGYATLADHAYPVLADLGFTATTFLVTDFIGKTNTWDVRYTWRRLDHLAWPAIERWKGRGFDFGSHSATHPRLTWLADDRMSDELYRSRVTLVERLGEDAGRAVAYPFGAVNASAARWAEFHGFALGFDGARGDPVDPYRLPRVPVYLWDVGNTPLGLRGDRLGAAGRLAADIANRCAVGTSVMLGLRRKP